MAVPLFANQALWPNKLCWPPTTGAQLTCALRPHLIWGPRDQHLIPRLIARARAGQLRRVGDGTNRVDMVYVENAAHALHASGPTHCVPIRQWPAEPISSARANR